MRRLYLIGGFGNLLFQALAYLHLNKKKATSINNTLISKNIYTKLLGWKVHQNLSAILFKNENQNIQTTFFETLIDLLFLYLSKYFKCKIFGRLWIKNANDLNQEFKAACGYFQTEDVFLFTSKHISVLKHMLNSTFQHKQTNVVVHFRGTDTVWGRNTGDYYKTALRTLNINSDIVVVTDDLKKARKEFPFCKEFVSGTLEDDFSLMISAKNLICAPSTLSWWAAIVSMNTKKVIMPAMMKELLPEISKEVNVVYV
jgi:hypothetical protein